jgi:excisionase family DNA binding protein
MLTVKEVANKLRVTEATVRNYIRKGEINAIKFGPRLIRMREEDVNDFIEKRQTAKHGKN